MEKLYTVSKNKTGSGLWLDHELLIAKFRLKLKTVGKTNRPFRYDLNQIPYDYTVEVRNRFKGYKNEMQAGAGKRSHSRPTAAVLGRRPACTVGPWLVSGNPGLYEAPYTSGQRLLTDKVVWCPGCLHKQCDLW